MVVIINTFFTICSLSSKKHPYENEIRTFWFGKVIIVLVKLYYFDKYNTGCLKNLLNKYYLK